MYILLNIINLYIKKKSTKEKNYFLNFWVLIIVRVPESTINPIPRKERKSIFSLKKI